MSDHGPNLYAACMGTDAEHAMIFELELIQDTLARIELLLRALLEREQQ